MIFSSTAVRALPLVLIAILVSPLFAASVDYPLVAVELEPNRIGDGEMIGGVRPNLCEEARLILLQPDGTREELVPGFHSSCEPDVSFDGEKILFSGKRAAGDSWNIYELSLETGDVRQITEAHGNCRLPSYQSTFYTIVSPEPWFQITFVSDAAGERNEGRKGRATHLYSCRLDGSEMRRLTYSPSADLDPFLLWDGRILYGALRGYRGPWQLQEKVDLFTINSDGADVALFTGFEGLPIKYMPAVSMEEQICLFVEKKAIDGRPGGRLGSVSIRRNLHSYESVTGVDDGEFLTPAPAPGGGFLVSSRVDQSQSYQLGFFDLTGSRFEPLPGGEDLVHGKVVKKRTMPDGRSSVVNEEHPYGQLYSLDVTINDLEHPDWLGPEVASRVRILEGLTRHRDEIDSPIVPKRILGEFDIAEDGSFFVEVPANIPLQIQLMDEDGMALRSCSWIWVKNKEPRGCIGCHEDAERTPPNRFVEAVKIAPVRLTQPERLRRHVDFRHDIVPILVERCADAGCHDGAGPAPSFRPEAEISDSFIERVYRLLTAGDGSDRELGRWIHAGEARTSPLVWHLTGRVTTRPWDPVLENPGIPVSGRELLPPNELQKVLEWIDLGAHGGSVVSEAVSDAADRERGL